MGICGCDPDERRILIQWQFEQIWMRFFDDLDLDVAFELMSFFWFASIMDPGESLFWYVCFQTETISTLIFSKDCHELYSKDLRRKIGVRRQVLYPKSFKDCFSPSAPYFSIFAAVPAPTSEQAALLAECRCRQCGPEDGIFCREITCEFPCYELYIKAASFWLPTHGSVHGTWVVASLYNWILQVWVLKAESEAHEVEF